MEIKTSIIFAGGKGTRFLEQTRLIPKPMIKANNLPLVVHIINHYEKYGVDNFIILTGYKKESFNDYFENNDGYKKLQDNKFTNVNNSIINLLDTGEETLTGGRLKIALNTFDLENFYLTYGDGISNVDLDKLKEFYFENDTIATVTAVSPPPRFGNLEIDENYVTLMQEKNETVPQWINGGFFVMNNKILNYLNKDEPMEQDPLRNLVNDKQLSAYKHKGYWQCVDTIRELEILEKDLIENKELF